MVGMRSTISVIPPTRIFLHAVFIFRWSELALRSIDMRPLNSVEHIEQASASERRSVTSASVELVTSRFMVMNTPGGSVGKPNAGLIVVDTSPSVFKA